MQKSKKERFTEFYTTMAQEISEIDPQICFFGFGSCFDRPDIENPRNLDGGIIMPTLVTDKNVVKTIAKKINQLRKVHALRRRELRINLLDLHSLRDGRFLPYTRDFTKFIVQAATTLTPEIHLPALNGLDNRFGIQEGIAQSFRAIRNDYLMTPPTFPPDNVDSFLENYRHALDRLERLPRKLACLHIYRQTGPNRYDEVIKFLRETDKLDTLKHMPEVVGPVDLSLFDRIEELRNTRSVGEAYTSWTKTVTAYESLIEGYIDNNPPKKITVETVV